MSDERQLSREEMSQPATKGDVVRLHDQLAALMKTVGELTTSVALLESRPAITQPCKAFESHITEHKVIQGDWRRAAIGFVFGVALAAFSGLLGYMIGNVNKADEEKNHEHAVSLYFDPAYPDLS